MLRSLGIATVLACASVASAQQQGMTITVGKDSVVGPQPKPGMTITVGSGGKDAPGLLPRSVRETRTRFDPQQVEIRTADRRWQLWADKTMLKDFGEQREHAYEARRLIAELKLNERASIGTPFPVMEYWLADGEAPPPPTLSRNIIPFDPGTLRVETVEGNYRLRDARQVLFQFGPYAEDAQAALAVCRNHQFNELGLIGLPTPSMVYLIRNPQARMGLAAPDSMFQPRLLPQQSSRHALMLPKLGQVGERTPFDPMRTDVLKRSDGWHLVAGPLDLANLGTSEYQARQTLRTIQQYPLTEHARIGTAGFSFYLSRGQAPRGVPIGTRHHGFDAKALTVKPVGDELQLTDGRHVLATFTTQQARDAQTALQVVRHYGFDTQVETGAIKFLARDR